jgi:hypothetical protein
LYHHFSELKTKKHWSWWSYTGLWFIEAVPPNCLLLKQRIAHSQFAQSHENSDPQKVMALGIEVRCKNMSIGTFVSTCFNDIINIRWSSSGGLKSSEKYESQWDGLSHILWKIIDVPNHQPVMIPKQWQSRTKWP